MAIYSKEQIALMQLTASIELFNQKKYIPAISLGAAAEELYDVFLKEHSRKNKINIPSKAELDASMFEMYKDILGIDDYISYRNNTRNELKHHGSSNKRVVKGNFKRVAMNHISGAIINCKLRTNELPKNKIIKEFCSEYGIS